MPSFNTIPTLSATANHLRRVEVKILETKMRADCARAKFVYAGPSLFTWNLADRDNLPVDLAWRSARSATSSSASV